MSSQNTPDVLVIGGGMAALCAAITARQAGASVLMVDRAPAHMRGGNARHSRNLRIAHDAPSPLFPGTYTVEEFLRDLDDINEGLGDPRLCRILAEGSTGLPAWLLAQGLHFELPAGGTLPWSRKTAFFLGGGRHAMNALFIRAQQLGVEILADTRVLDLDLSDRPVRDVHAEACGLARTFQARSIIMCSGGYQANRERLVADMGEMAKGFIVRGTPHVEGELLFSLLNQGAQSSGRKDRCHLVAVNALAPWADGGIVTRVDGMRLGLVVNRHGDRFQDEGAVISPRRYSFWGARVATCPGSRAFLVMDDDAFRRAPASIYPAISARTPEELADRLGLDRQRLADTIARYNAACRVHQDHGGHTVDLQPCKSRHALPLRTPPFHAHVMAPGITFTGYGLQVDNEARILHSSGEACRGLYAAGMIMAPAILGGGYTAGVALTVSGVFGRIAGAHAAAAALRSKP